MIKKLSLIIIFSCLIIGLGYFTPRHAFGQLFGLYSALFVVYFFLVKTIKNPREIFFTGIFFRLLLLFSIPALSDDFYRFVWDGRLLINGLNPYTILPAEFIQSPDFQAIMGDKSIFQHLNSPNYYTVYPPLNQFIFAISAWLSQGSLFWNVVWLRVFIILATAPEAPPAPRGGNPTPTLPEREGEKAPPLGAGGASGALYHFNPLIIIELTGNLHFEAVVICFLFLAYRSLSKIKSPLRRFGKVFSVKKTSSSTQNLTPKSPLRKGEGTFYKNLIAPLRKGEGTFYKNLIAPVRKGEGTFCKNLIAPLRKGERTFYKNLIAPLRKGEGTFCKNLIAPLLRGGVDAGLFLSAFFFACAVSTKMLPLILMPLIVKQLGLKKGLIYASIVGIFTLLFFVPFIDTLLSEKLFSSINLYFQKFEFNASIYYLVREIGFKLLGYNIIGTAGKVMAFLIFGGIVFISWKSKNLFNGALGVLTLYFAMATTVHPWYVSTLVAITIFSKFRYPIVWSYLIFLSYATYQTNLYQENLWLVFVEYSAVLGVIIYEWKSHKIIKENK